MARKLSRKCSAHEDKIREGFDKCNAELNSTAKNAFTFANILMPIMISIGYIQYVVVATVGAGTMAINGVGGLTLGHIVSFMQLSRNFNQPINMMSQQVSAVGHGSGWRRAYI